MSDAVNVCLTVGPALRDQPPPGAEESAGAGTSGREGRAARAAGRASEEEDTDMKVEVKEEEGEEEGVATAGAQWEIFRREDVPALTEWLHWKWCRGELAYQVAAAATRCKAGLPHIL